MPDSSFPPFHIKPCCPAPCLRMGRPTCMGSQGMLRLQSQPRFGQWGILAGQRGKEARTEFFMLFIYLFNLNMAKSMRKQEQEFSSSGSFPNWSRWLGLGQDSCWKLGMLSWSPIWVAATQWLKLALLRWQESIWRRGWQLNPGIPTGGADIWPAGWNSCFRELGFTFLSSPSDVLELTVLLDWVPCRDNLVHVILPHASRTVSFPHSFRLLTIATLSY